MKKYISILIIVVLLMVSICSTYAGVGAVSTAGDTSKIDSALLKELEGMDSDDSIDVSVWTTDIDTSTVDETMSNEITKMSKENNVLDKAVGDNIGRNESDITKADKLSELTADQIDSLVMLEREEKSKLYEKQNYEMIKKILKVDSNKAVKSASVDNTEVQYVSKYAPNFEATLTKSEILNIIKNDEVTDIFISVNDSFTDDNYSNNISDVSELSSSEEIDDWYFDNTGITELRDNYGLDGTGMKVGTIEGIVPDASLPCFANANITNREYDDIHYSGAPINGHINFTTSFMAAVTDNYTGAIPNAHFFSASTNNPDGEMKGAFEWVISQGVNVITSSVYLGHDNNNEYGDYAKWLDHIMYQHNVVFVMMGPNGTEMITGSMAYNTILVGNANRNNEMYSGFLSGSNLPCKPDILAPGDGLSTCLGTSGGTSVAAPIAASAAVQLIQYSQNLKLYPMMTKAILLNGANYLGEENPCNIPMSFNAFKREGGAGVLNVKDSLSVIDSLNMYMSTCTNTNSSYTYSNAIYVSDADINNNKKIKVTQCSAKENTVDGDHVSGNVTNNIINCYRVDVTNRSNNDNWYSYDYYDNKVSVYFTPEDSGYYDIKVTCLTPSTNRPSKSYLVSRLCD